MTHPDPLTNLANQAPGKKQVPGEMQFILVIVAMVMILAITGLPGQAEKIAGDGSDELRLGWAQQRTAEAGVDGEDAVEVPAIAPAEDR